MNEQILGDILVFSGLMALLGTIAKLSLAFIKARSNRSAPSAGLLDQIAQRLEVLQQSVDATSIEVERLGEGQRFTTKLLAERNGASERQRVAEQVITPH